MIKHILSRALSAAWLAAAGASLVAVGANGWAQSYPEKPIKMVVSSAAGGQGDTMTRVAADLLGKRLGVAVAVENLPGAGSTIGAGFVARAPGDGYTLLHSSNQGLGLTPSSIKYNFDPDKDLAPVAQLAEAPALIAVPTRIGVNSLAEFVARAKANPGKLAFASSGPGSATHFAGELFRLRAGIDLLHVPYKGSAAGITDAIGGRIDMVILGTVSVQAPEKAGQIRGLALMAPKRSPALPELPTTVELGYPDAILLTFYGVFAPGTTPQPILQKLAQALEEVGRSPEYKVAVVDKLGNEVSVKLLDEFKVFLQKEKAFWHGVAKDAGMKF